MCEGKRERQSERRQSGQGETAPVNFGLRQKPTHQQHARQRDCGGGIAPRPRRAKVSDKPNTEESASQHEIDIHQLGRIGWISTPRRHQRQHHARRDAAACPQRCEPIDNHPFDQMTAP